MNRTQELIEVFCGSATERHVARTLANTTGMIDQASFWAGMLAYVRSNLASTSFSDYSQVIKSYLFCAAVQSDIWPVVAIDKLTEEDETCSLDAFTMGTLIGTFEAGVWLQERNKVLEASFLVAVAEFCTIFYNTPIKPTNIEKSEIPLDRLDKAVKNYLRPSRKDTAQLIAAQVPDMLATLQRNFPTSDQPVKYPDNIAKCLMRSLLYGVINPDGCSDRQLLSIAGVLNI